MTKFSIVICTYNNWRAISRVLPAVLQEAKRLGSTEVIVVDSSTDGSAQRVMEAFPEARVIQPPTRLFPGPARNLGFESSVGEFVIFLDGDCQPKDGWLAGYAARATSYEEGSIICGSVDLFEPCTLPEFVEYLIWKLPECSRVPRGGFHFVITENMMLSRSTLERIGRFGNSDSANDAQFDSARLKNGSRLMFEPVAGVKHIHPPGTAFHIKKLFRIGIEQIELMRTLDNYRVGRLMRMFFPIVFLLRWLRISGRVIRLRPDYLPRYLIAQPILITGLLANQAGMWAGLLQWTRRR